MADKTGDGVSRYKDFTSDEERRLTKSYLRKVDLRLLPICCLVYCTAIWDRNNVGNAKAAGMEAYLGLHGEQFNWIISAFFFTYIFCEVPSNMLLKKFGARIWLPFITVAWSILCACMAAGKTYASLIVIRIIMGVFEAGLVPGFIFLASFWYTKRQLGPRMSLFFSAGTFAGIWSGPLAAGLQNIKGSLMGYQYIFLVEGCVSMLVALLAYLVMPGYPETASFLTRDERNVAMRQLGHERALAAKTRLSPKQIVMALVDWKLWVYALMFWACTTGGASQAIFGPTLIKAMGYTATKAQMMSAIPSACGFVGQLLSSVLPRYCPHIGLLICVAASVSCASYAVIASSTGIPLRFGFLCLAQFGLAPILPWSTLWMTSNTMGITKRGAGSALTVMLGGIAGIVSSQIYRERDAPFYRFGHWFNCACEGLIVVWAIGLSVYFWRENKRRSRVNVDISTLTDDEIEDLCDKHPNFRYVY
ncbi:MFS general substrate transporter [Martensiomyces pterosporus]|nr:MFS general substrate transporter [Martensiomyces pterosporus]